MTADDPYQVVIRISAASARQPFHGCEPGYIERVCQAACCRSSIAPSGIIVTIHRSERAAVEGIRLLGGEVTAGLVQPRPGERRCPAQRTDGLCSLHATPAKPFGCIASPFTINRNGTLVVRNRYRLLRCYRAERRAEWDDPGGDGPPLPAYEAFRGSLDLILGAESERVCAHLAAGGGDLYVAVARRVYGLLRDLDVAKSAASKIPR